MKKPVYRQAANPPKTSKATAKPVTPPKGRKPANAKATTPRGPASFNEHDCASDSTAEASKLANVNSSPESVRSALADDFNPATGAAGKGRS